MWKIMLSVANEKRRHPPIAYCAASGVVILVLLLACEHSRTQHSRIEIDNNTDEAVEITSRTDARLVIRLAAGQQWHGTLDVGTEDGAFGDRMYVVKCSKGSIELSGWSIWRSDVIRVSHNGVAAESRKELSKRLEELKLPLILETPWSK